MNILLLTTVAVLGLSTLPWAVPFFLLGVELIYLLSAARLPFLRGYLDRELVETKREQALEARHKLLGAMNDDHRAELEHIEFLVETMRSGQDHGAASTAPVDPSSSHPMVDEHLGLERLMARYAEVAVAHREARRRLALTDCETVEAQLRVFDKEEQLHGADEPDEARGLREQRRRIARKRLECYRQNVSRLELMRRELAAIGELVRLLHEHTIICPCATGEGKLPGERERQDRDIERAISDLEEFHEGLVEISATLQGAPRALSEESASAAS